MRKFGEVVKEKINEAENRQETKILEDFKLIYNAMLEHYNMTSIKTVDEETQISFLTELNSYWNEDEGLNEKGSKFLQKRSISLNENSTATQKKNFLRAKTYVVINETIRQSNLRNKIYDIIDEMYHQLKASDISDILTPDMITSIISESLNKSLDEFTNKISKELKESSKSSKKYFVKVKTR